MAEHSHFFLHDGGAEPIDFTPRPPRIEPSPLPQRDAQEHGNTLRDQYEHSIDAALRQFQ